MNLSSISSKNLAELEKFWHWMQTTNRASIVSFNISGNQLRSLFDYDPTEYWDTSLVVTLSEHIKDFLNLTAEEVSKFYTSDPGDWNESENPALYHTYRLFKLLWLARDIKNKDVQESPVQIFKTKRGYNCHPGSDKRHVITLLQPLEIVRCFYIWYPELDPEPWHHNIEYADVESIDQFVELFYRADHETFTFGTHDASFEHGKFTVSDNHISPFATGANQIISHHKYNGETYFEHLSYRDGIHRESMNNSRYLLDEIYLDADNVFHLGEFTFRLINDTWIPESYLNSPKSLIDTEWQHDAAKTLSFKL